MTPAVGYAPVIVRESHTQALVMRLDAGIGWRELDDERVLALAARKLPYNIRPALASGGLAIMAGVPAVVEAESVRTAWLEGEMRRVAAGLDERRPVETGVSGSASEAPIDWETVAEKVRWIAAAIGWTVSDTTSSTLRCMIPGELGLPPLVATLRGEDLLLERPVPVLPARSAGAVVRAATAHAVLHLNAILLLARVAIRDAASLVAVVEGQVPAGDAGEDEIACLLEGVRYGAGQATGVLACLRNPAVAAEYAIAHGLPPATGEREQA